MTSKIRKLNIIINVLSCYLHITESNFPRSRIKLLTNAIHACLNSGYLLNPIFASQYIHFHLILLRIFPCLPSITTNYLHKLDAVGPSRTLPYIPRFSKWILRVNITHRLKYIDTIYRAQEIMEHVSCLSRPYKRITRLCQASKQAKANIEICVVILALAMPATLLSSVGREKGCCWLLSKCPGRCVCCNW